MPFERAHDERAREAVAHPRQRRAIEVAAAAATLSESPQVLDFPLPRDIETVATDPIHIEQASQNNQRANLEGARKPRQSIRERLVLSKIRFQRG